ncbi:MAG: nucleoside deaminase [Desulfobulbaceae bacterium]|nr:MAG: nucleoside deaminase [Desulfobulbaceae bacterium]
MSHQKFIREAIALAETMFNEGEGGPFAALVVRDQIVLGRGWNRVTSALDPTAHAEIEAIRQACQQVRSFNLAGCILYVNCEPCPMCLAAIYWAGIKSVYYAADRHDAAAIGFADHHIYEELAGERTKRKIPMRQMMREEALTLFNKWREKPDKTSY